ncbi:hypothetical protein [Kineosporia babensis]|uniref:DUF2238 domain-containing protein n=1 Tax=Kineosporia babensis TaxID=499548 RepID=A0A9X1SVI8_9ACTN|nr:hypothetical protein [Kineosporia babensis]MCD5312895.1 hypothetical protein [Kineosporia babensis]
MSRTEVTPQRRSLPAAAWISAVLLALTVGQLLVATFFAAGLEQFEGKGFGARLVLYPAMMLAVPVIWWLVTKDRRDVPWAAFAWIMLPYLIDVTGNTLNLYDTVGWWDEANHFVNWMFLGLGAGLLITRGERGRARPRWEIALLVAGIGAVMAIFWEVGEYYAFIRGGTELATAYTDTLSDEVLGTLGALLAGLIIARRT